MVNTKFVLLVFFFGFLLQFSFPLLMYFGNERKEETTFQQLDFPFKIKGEEGKPSFKMIINENAGKKQGKRVATKMIEILRRKGFGIDAHITKEGEAFQKMNTWSLSGLTGVLVVGGDVRKKKPSLK